MFYLKSSREFSEGAFFYNHNHLQSKLAVTMCTLCTLLHKWNIGVFTEKKKNIQGKVLVF